MPERVNLLAPDVRANPYPVYAEMRRSSPVCQVEPGGLWAVTRYDDVSRVLTDAGAFSSQGARVLAIQPWLPHNPLVDSMVLMDPPQHTKNRALVSKAFGAQIVPRVEPLLRAAAEKGVKRMREGQPFDFCSDFAAPLPAAAIADLLGLDQALGAEFRRWTEDLVSVGPMTPPEAMERIRGTVSELEKCLMEVIQARRAAPRGDLVSDLLRAEIDGARLSDPDVVSFLFLLLMAGFETTAHLLAHAVLLLTEYPDVHDRLRRDRSLVPAFVQEVLRFQPAVHSVMRVAAQDTALGGVTLPKGSLVLALIASAGRDDAYFKDPDRFDMERPPQVGMPFGHGPHACLGAALARAEARIGLEVLLSLPGRLERARPGPIDWNVSLTVRGPRALWLRYVE